MKDRKINLLANYHGFKKINKNKIWIITGVLSAFLFLLFILYAFLFRAQNNELHVIRKENMSLKKQLDAQKDEFPVVEKTESIFDQSINLQQTNADLRTVLQQIAAQANINLLLHESVKGEISISFNQLPWEQALQVVLDLADLTSEQQENVLIIRSKQQKIEKIQKKLENQQHENEIIPLETLVIPIHYAKANVLADLMSTDNQEWLSARGTVSVDERTNALLIRDIPSQLLGIQNMIGQLDVPIRQVSIEARILNVEDSFSRELGIIWQLEGNANISANQGNINSANSLQMNFPDYYNNAKNLAMTTLSGDILLNLELRALESENLVEELAHPRLVTADQQTAIIRQGEEIPYQQSAEYGASTISFKPAVLELQVTPHITPDNRIMMKLVVKNDSRSAQALAEDVPVITTKEIRTQVLVNNGETIVLGGIYTQGSNQQIERLPFLGSLPGIGRFFSNEIQQNERKELVVFVTPRIIEHESVKITS